MDDGLGPKVEAPAARRGLVSRTGLVNRLMASDEPVITVVAPPGYGKTTLLAQFAERVGPRVAWVSCEESDNDPVALWNAVAVALSRIEPATAAAVAQRLTALGGGVGAVPGLVSALAAIRGPLVLVLDQVDAITSMEARASIAEFAVRVPRGWRLALASRDAVPIPSARLRTQGRIVEVGAGDLAMAVGEATALLRGAGVELSASETDELVYRTEGWPAGLYIAALARNAGSQAVGFTFTGDDRLMGDYLRSELLPRVSAKQANFLIVTSVLDRMTGALCDAVVGRKGSARVLEELVNRNLLVVPLDRRGGWYRYHHLLRELLQAELQRDAPELVPQLHSRAAAWYQANAQPEAAVEHAKAAGDSDLVASLVLDLMQPVWTSGRVETVRGWMEWLRDRPSAQHYAAIAAHGALIFALLGRPGEAERWAAVAERLPATGTLPDGSTVAGTLAYLRAILCRQGVAAMRHDALDALEGLSPASPYRATMLYTEGISYLLDEDLERADTVFAHAFDMASASEALPLGALSLAERLICATDRDDWPAADQFAQQMVEIVDASGYDSYWSSALVYASAAHHAAHRGDVSLARDYAKRAVILRPLLTYALPVVSVQALHELARTYIALADPAGARAVLAQASTILQQRPHLGSLAATDDRLRSQVGEIAGAAVGASSLTAAELRLLPLLSTHLSFPEIGERLYVSRHTVKSQALSLYRKLGVSSRGEAVHRMSELGLHAH